MSRVFFFAFTAALNPTLLTATTVMLLLPNPRRLMLGYLAGALTNGIVVGIAIVEWLSSSGAVSETKRTVAPGIDLAVGVLALLAAHAFHSGRVERALAHRRERRADELGKTPHWQEVLRRGSARTSFVVGLLLSFPGASYLVSLTQISRLDLSPAGVVLTVVVVNAVMLVVLEVPLISFTVAPKWTPTAVERFKAWIALHGARATAATLTAIGLLFVARGMITITV